MQNKLELFQVVKQNRSFSWQFLPSCASSFFYFYVVFAFFLSSKYIRLCFPLISRNKQQIYSSVYLEFSMKECTGVRNVYICLYDLCRQSWIAVGKHLEVYSEYVTCFWESLLCVTFTATTKRTTVVPRSRVLPVVGWRVTICSTSQNDFRSG